MHNIHISTPAEGIKLTCVTTNKWKTSLLSACFVLPLGAKYRSAAALLPYALRSSCKKYPGRMDVAKRLDELYGAMLEPFAAKRGEAQIIGVMADAIDEKYAETGTVQQTAQLLTDILLNPSIPIAQQVLENEVSAACAKIASLPNNKRAWAVRRMYQLMCRDEDYRFCEYGDISEVSALTPEIMAQVYEKVLKTAPLELFYCGSMPPELVESIFSREFAALSQRDSIIKPEFYAPSFVKNVRFETETENVSQGKLAIGLRTGITVYDKLYPAMILFNACFGGTTGSRLFTKVREEKSLCYYASSSTDKLKGVMAVTSGIENKNEQPARDEILHQLELIRQGDLTDDEIENARRSVKASLYTMNDSQYSLENFYQTQAAAGLDFTITDLMKKIDKVTKDDIVRASCMARTDTVYFLKGAVK